MRTLTQPLNMSPGGIPPVIHVSQYDSDFTIVFNLFSTIGDFTIESGTTAMVRGTKSSGTGYSADAAINISAKTVTVTGNQQMTAAAGQNIFEITLLKDNKEISSKNFILLCERAALDADTITDESVLKELNAIIESADTATQAAEEAKDAADRAEAAAQTLVTDSTLTHSGQAADAKATGDAIAEIEDEIAQIVPGMSYEAKEALLACFAHVAWTDEHGQDYYDALENALYPETGLVRITVTFTQGSAVIYEDGELNDLKAYLTVTGYYNNGTSKTETDYSLAGTLTVGTSTITVSKEGKTATFDVTVSALPTIKLFVGKGTSGASLIDNAKRLLSEPIPFSNIEPITMRWKGISGYRYAIKNMISDTVVDTTGTAYYPAQFDYGDDVDAVGAKYETWVITDDLQTKGHTLDAEEQTWEPLYFSNTSGYMRILLANRDALSYDLPSTMPSGYITVQGTKYKIEVKEKNEFI